MGGHLTAQLNIQGGKMAAGSKYVCVCVCVGMVAGGALLGTVQKEVVKLGVRLWK